MVRKILFVDDDEILQLAVEKRFAVYSDSFTVAVASDGFEALKRLESISVSVVVIDLLMPRMDGLSLLSHIQEKYPDIPVILISSLPATEMPHLSGMKGIVGYLEKPFKIDGLRKKIVAILQDEAAGGIMHNVSPTMFLQLMEMEGKTCTIRILNEVSGEGGILYLLDGQLLDARIGTLRGIEAAYRIFSWDEVTVFIRSECAPRENVINSDLQPIIMGALAAKDEADDSPFADSEGSLSGLSSLAGDADVFPGQMSGPEEDVPGMGALREISEPFWEPLRKLIYQEAGEKCGLQKIGHDRTLDRVVTTLAILADSSEFGELRVGFIESKGETDMFLVSGPEQQAIVLEVDSGCPVNTIMDALRYRD